MTLQWPNNILLVRNSYGSMTTLKSKSTSLKGKKKSSAEKNPKPNMKEEKKKKKKNEAWYKEI